MKTLSANAGQVQFTVHWPPARRALKPMPGEGPLTAAEQALGPYPSISRRFRDLVHAYVWFNPHLSIRGSWFGREFIDEEEATNPTWDKWRPRNPTSAHWYDQARLQRYLAAHVAKDRDLGRHRTVRAFIAEFRGLLGTAVQRKWTCLVKLESSLKQRGAFDGQGASPVRQRI